MTYGGTNKQTNMKQKLQLAGSKLASLYAVALVAIVFAFGSSSASAAPIDVDPADAIAQVAATAADVLPYVMALAAAGIVFKLIRRWIR